MTGDPRRDAFLGGRLHLWQPSSGYRAGVDPVLLAASVPAAAGQTVLDLGCGAGAVALCLGARVPGLTLAGLELNPDMAALARRNAKGAGQNFEVTIGDVADMPGPLRARVFDHVVMNPPYYDRARGSSAPDAARELALAGDIPLGDWIKAAAKRVKPRGFVHMIVKADRLAEAISALNERLGSIEVLPLAPRAGRDAELVILRARKEGRAALRLHAPVILHDGAAHTRDADDYTPAVAAVLRCGETLEF